MCTIMAALGAALSGVQSIAGFAGQSQAADAANAQAAAAHRDALISYQNKVGDLQRQYIYNERAAQQKGYAATLKGRAAAATGLASSGSAGVGANSITLEQLMNDERQVTAENLNRVRSQQEDLKDQYIGQSISAQYDAQGRINSVPFRMGPNPASLGLQLAAGGINAFNQQNYFTAWGQQNLMTPQS